jgi:hypothetical protein
MNSSSSTKNKSVAVETLVAVVREVLRQVDSLTASLRTTRQAAVD